MTQPEAASRLRISAVPGLRTILLGVLALFWILALIGTPGAETETTEVLIVDFSRSVHPEIDRILDALAIEAEVTNREDQASSRIIVGFASDARILATPPPAVDAAQYRRAAAAVLRDLPAAWREGSDLLAGVRQGLAAGDRPDAPRLKLRVLGDLRHRPGEIDEAFRLARAAGAGLEFAALDPRPRLADLRLSLDGPAPSLRPGEPAILQLRLDSVAAGRRAVTVSAGGRSSTTSIDPATGSHGLQLSVTPPAGASEIEVRISDAGGPDADPANDRLTLPVAGEGRLRLYVCGSLAAAVRDLITGPAAEVKTGDKLPRDPASFDAVILADHPLAGESLGEEAVLGLMRAVDERGTGLLVLGGPHAFRAGGYAGSALDEFLPLSSRTPEGRDIRVLLDHSGSMDGGDRLGRAIEAVLSLARGLGPKDRLQVIPFAAAPDLPVPSVPAAPAEVLAMGDRLWSLRPGGGTAVVAALDAARWESGAPSERILAIISDLRDERLDDAAAIGRLRATWEQDHVSVAVLLLDGEAESRARVAALGARLHALDQITPEVFLQAIEAQAWKREELEVSWREGAMSGQVAGVLRAWNPTTPGREARLLLEGRGGEPLGAEARRGAGRVIAVATDLTLEAWTRAVVPVMVQRIFGVSRGSFSIQESGGVLSVTGPPDRASGGPLVLVSGGATIPLREESAGQWIAKGRPDDRLPWQIRDAARGEIVAAVSLQVIGDPEFRVSPAAAPDRAPPSLNRGSGQRLRWPCELMIVVVLCLLSILGPGRTANRS